MRNLFFTFILRIPQSYKLFFILQESKDLETASVVSSAAGSARGRPAENGPTMDLTNQPTQVEVNT